MQAKGKEVKAEKGICKVCCRCKSSSIVLEPSVKKGIMNCLDCGLWFSEDLAELKSNSVQ